LHFQITFMNMLTMLMEENSKRIKIEEFVEMMPDACEKQFPKKCNCCCRYFDTFQDFLKYTIIPVHSKDHSLQLIDLENLHDVIAFRNCSCGTTMTVQCAVDKPQKKELMHAISRALHNYKRSSRSIRLKANKFTAGNHLFRDL